MRPATAERGQATATIASPAAGAESTRCYAVRVRFLVRELGRSAAGVGLDAAGQVCRVFSDFTLPRLLPDILE